MSDSISGILRALNRPTGIDPNTETTRPTSSTSTVTSGNTCAIDLQNVALELLAFKPSMLFGVGGCNLHLDVSCLSCTAIL